MPLLDSNGEGREGEQNRQKTSSWDSNSGNLMRTCAICWSASHKAIAPTRTPSLRLLCTLLLSPQWGELHSRLLPNTQSCIMSQKCGLQVRLQGLSVPFGTEPISSPGAPCQYSLVCLFDLTTKIHCSWCCLESEIGIFRCKYLFQHFTHPVCHDHGFLHSHYMCEQPHAAAPK